MQRLVGKKGGAKEEKATGRGGHRRAQEVELMVSVASLGATMVGVNGVNHREGRRILQR